VRLLDHGRQSGEVLQLDIHLLDPGLPPALDRLEGAGADQRQPRLALPADVDVDRVVKGGSLADELPVLLRQLDEVPVQARVEPRRKPGGNVGRQHRGAEENRVEAMSADQVCGHVHARLGQRRGKRRVVGEVDLRSAEPGRLRRQALDTRARDQRRDIVAELSRLAEHAQRVLLQLALVVLEEDERAHKAFRSSRNSTIFSAPVPSSSIRCVSPRGGGSPIA